MSALESFRCLVAGDLVGGQQVPVLNPATEEAVATCHVADDRMVDVAVDAAIRAFASWRSTPLVERRALLMRMADILRDNATHLARLLTLEQGKPLTEARQELAGAEAFFRHCAAVDGTVTESLFTTDEDKTVRTYTPLGVVAGIVPWNFPLLIAAMKVGPALLTGNAVIIKPAPTTPLTTLAFARLCAEHVPEGLLQVLGDDGRVGPMLVAHPGIRKIAFTGSTRTGRTVMATAASTLKRLTLELGGNDPALVLRDADPASAAEGIFRAAFTNAGQICGAVKRVYVHEDLYAPFCQSLATLVDDLVIGNGLEPGVTLGPVQNRVQYEKAITLLADAQQQGQILAQRAGPSSKGYFVPPTVFGGLSDEHPLVTDEQFAPLLPVQRFASESEAINRANSTPYGLTASVWSADERHAEAVAHQIDAGLLCINKHNEAALDWGIPLAKQSGSGWLLGDAGIKEYLQPHLLVR